MLIEITRAADFLVKLLRIRCGGRNLNEAQLALFKGALSSLLRTRYRDHWFPERPNRGSAYRCIRINGKMDPVIAQAGAAVGLPPPYLRGLFPSELTLWIDPQEVSYRIDCPSGPPPPPLCATVTDVHHLSLMKIEWQYRGEGNANLVLALTKERMIVRLHKTRRDAFLTSELEVEEMRRVCREAFFCRTVMVPLLGAAYIQPPTVARVQHREIRRVDAILLPQRPAFRHHKGISFGYVNIYPDYALLPERLSPGAATPTFCVEIKPKQGWIPSSPAQHPKCTFCLNQYLKLANGAINKISQYCPLDLFSGDEKRMKKAIKALLKTPQNNLKIFEDGHLVYSGESSQDLSGILRRWLGGPAAGSRDKTFCYYRLEEVFCSLVYRALTTDLLGPAERPVVEDRYWPLIGSPGCRVAPSPSPGSDCAAKLEPCDPAASPLPPGCILERILSIQKLQQNDTETVHQSLWQYRGCGDYDYVTKLCDPESERLRLDPIQRYLLATTAKDCSVLVAFQHLRNDETAAEKHVVTAAATEAAGSSERYVFNIGVSDLDPKPLSCVEKHRKRDADIRHACSAAPPPSPTSPPSPTPTQMQPPWG